MDQKALDSFVRLHAHRIANVSTKEPIAHLVPFSHSGIPVDVTLTQYSFNDITSSFDTNSTTVRWLLNQMTTYDPEKSRILGLIFQNDHVLAHVIMRGNVKDEESD